ncbi:PIR Superfamily Protein [Plasmodium ovale wallikeri]|uniref:PIR Superfamily Protein n=2 Tax=Plasmodium ovale TaxID=36330 RepID=A0A1A9AKC7_PLAOA|nr:PIR Superfamily Protein [Plasmodium ovale wallikeri]SBT58030.1 PIR Superfamily Protein [Plasmodium ovale wallikeri]SBT74083.1 Plasmodium vivax Vir protein, putative [Plasmodium ovale]
MTITSARSKHLVDLPSFQFNRELNKDVSECFSCSLCDRPEYISPDDYPLKIICYYFVRNLEILESRKTHDTNKKNMYCNHLIHWMHNKYYDLEKKRQYKDFDDFFNKIDKVRNVFFSEYTSRDNFCDNIISRKLTLLDIGRRKDFHDYYMNYKDIEEKLKEKGEKCYNFFNYLNTKKDFYASMIEQCKNDPQKKYCEHFKYQDCDPKELLKLPKCKELEPKDDAQGDNSQSGDPCSHMRGWETSYYSLNFSDYRVVLLTGLAIWGILITLHFLYKNTPVWLWIRNFLRKKEIIRNNFDEDIEHDMLSDNSDHLHENLERPPYNVGYYPA